MTFGQVICQCVLLSCKQWFIGCRVCVLPCNLFSKLDAGILLAKVLVEFVNFVFVYSSDRMVKVT